MSSNAVQLQKGLSMAQFIECYGTEAKCHAALLAARWPKGFICPNCKDERYSTFICEGHQHRQCHRCRRQTTAITGMLFEASKLPLMRWFPAMHLMTQAKNNVSALKLKRHLGVRYTAAWRMKQKLLHVVPEREASRVLGGGVDVDYAYLGRERVDNRGRSSEIKVGFVAALQATDDGRPMLVQMDRIAFTKDAIEGWGSKALSASARVIFDRLNCFAGFRDNAAIHKAVVVGSGCQSESTHPEFRRQYRAFPSGDRALGHLSSSRFRQVRRPTSG